MSSLNDPFVHPQSSRHSCKLKSVDQKRASLNHTSFGRQSTNPALGHVRQILTNFVAFREVPVEREGWGRLRSTACAGTTSTSTWLPPSEISTSDM